MLKLTQGKILRHFQHIDNGLEEDFPQYSKNYQQTMISEIK